jgi:hypothetical protein
MSNPASSSRPTARWAELVLLESALASDSYCSPVCAASRSANGMSPGERLVWDRITIFHFPENGKY